jgi:hypothetical protein
MESQTRTRKRLASRLTITSLRGWLIYKPLAILMAILMLPAISWMQGGGAGTRPFQAYAQIAPLSVNCLPTTGPTTVGQAWSSICTAANGTPPYSWSITSGALPAGISGPSPASGGFTDLGGTPTTPGSYSWVITATDFNGSTATASFGGTLNSVQGCASTTNTIIQNYCGSGSPLQNDLVQLESDAVNLYLAMHQLPATDAQLVYQYGREDLRNDIRGAMMTILKAIILEPASQRSTHDQNLYSWLQTMVRQNEIAEYTQALNNYNSFKNDPCHYQLDPDIASQYGLKFDGTPWCFIGAQTSAFRPPTPDVGYFLSYGMKQSYEKPVTIYPYFGGLVAEIRVGEANIQLPLAITGITILGAPAVYASLASAIRALYYVVLTSLRTLPPTYAGIDTMQAALALARVAPVINVIGALADFLGPIGILLDCTISEFQAGMEITNEQNANAILKSISIRLAQVQNAPPDLTAFVNDPEQLQKLRMTVASQTLPDLPSTASLPAHRSGDLNFIIAPESGGPGTTATTLQYQDWSKDTWTAQTYGRWFVQTCTTGADATGPCGPYSDSLTGNLYYTDWSGVNWIALRNGTTFVSSKASPASTDVSCPANAATGISAFPTGSTSFSNCFSYASTSIPLTDANGNHVSVSFAPQGLPVFTTPSNLSFVPNIASTQTITVSGNPTPQISVASSNLPNDVSLSISSGTLQLAFSGDRAQNATPQSYNLTLEATNSVGTTTQTFAVTVSPQLAIISPNSMTVTTGIPASFTVVTTGTPPPALSVDGVPLGTLTFKDNGDGTATISGIDLATLTTLGCLVNHAGTVIPCAIVATNSQGVFRQPFTVYVNSAPGASIAGSQATTFNAGAANQVLLVSTGAITPVSWWLQTDPTPPSWLTLNDNGNGTATLSGTPPAGTTGTFNVVVVPEAQYSLPTESPYAITVLDVPVFTTQNTTTFTAGTFGSFSIGANMGTIGMADTLPPGLSFAASGSAATVSGTPAAGTGGQYQFTLTDDAGTNGTATQTLTLNVNEAPQITSAATATMFVGIPGMFAVTTTGFPSVSNHMIPANAPPPTDPSQGVGMYFTVTGLPADLSFSNLDPVHFAVGTLTIQGTPSAADAGQHQVQITAQNGVGQAAQQTLALNIVQITGSAPTSGATCNGNYSGTFNGNINVSSGQNCAFYGGGVNGNISVNGGHLALSNSTVSGNVSVQGGSGFSFGPGTNIQKNLSIQNVGSGSTASQICQATVSGNLEISGNAIPIQIGNPQNFCFGSSFGKNVDISGNTAPVTVYENTVGKNLSCSGNTSITGGGNTAQQKGGQCAGF